MQDEMLAGAVILGASGAGLLVLSVRGWVVERRARRLAREVANAHLISSLDAFGARGSVTEAMMNMSQAQPTLRSAVEALPTGVPITVRSSEFSFATPPTVTWYNEDEGTFRYEKVDPVFCPDTTAERARAALEAARAAVPEPDVYAWFDPEKGRGRG